MLSDWIFFVIECIIVFFIIIWLIALDEIFPMHL
jgi:hypothetical protein